MPLSCPSLHLNRSAYLPTEVTSSGFTGASYIGSNVVAFGFASPGGRPLASRSSWHVAQGQPCLNQKKVHALLCPSRQSISTPVAFRLLQPAPSPESPHRAATSCSQAPHSALLLPRLRSEFPHGSYRRFFHACGRIAVTPAARRSKRPSRTPSPPQSAATCPDSSSSRTAPRYSHRSRRSPSTRNSTSTPLRHSR